MRIIDRIDKYMDESDLNDNQLTVNCGLSVGLLGKARQGKSDIGKKALEKILTFYQDLNKTWLLTGEGSMLKKSIEVNSQNDPSLTGKVIPFYDVEAVAGYDYETSMGAVSRPIGTIEIGSVLRDSESAIRVYGNSMTPNYPAGCVIGLRLHTDSFIEPGRVYIVETRDNRYLKRLYYTEDKSAFLCLSDNQMKYEDGARKGKFYYQEFEIPIEEVIRLHRVVGVIKRNIL